MEACCPCLAPLFSEHRRLPASSRRLKGPQLRMEEELLGREAELRRVLGYIAAAENQVNHITRGRDGSVAGFLFSQPSFLRSVQSCLAVEQLPVFVVEGVPGVGRSALLEETFRRCSALPGLRAVRGRRSAVALLRRLYDGIDEASDEELVLMPVLHNAGRQAGVVLLLDDMEVGPWLPSPLPPGVRCIIAPPSGASPCLPAQVAIRLEPLALEAAEVLRQRWHCTAPGPSLPLWLRLAAELRANGRQPEMLTHEGPPASVWPSSRHFPRDLTGLVDEMVASVEAELGSELVLEALSAVSCSRAGLRPEELRELEGPFGVWPVIEERLSLLLDFEEGSVQLKTLLQEALDRRGLGPAAQRWHRRLADFFLLASSAERRIEAAHHLAALGDTERLLEAMTDWSLFSILEKEHRSALLEYCHKAGGYQTVRRALVKMLHEPNCENLQQRRIVLGRFLSHVGEFAAAKEILLQARAEATAAERTFELGQVCNLIAENEIRYWDSLRNWSSMSALRDLLDSAQTAVNIFEKQLEMCDRMSTRVEYAQALSRWANACFKVSCVINMVMAYSFLSKADESIQTVEDLFKGCPPSKVVGRAILVRGVAKLVLGHNRQRHRLPHREILVEAVELLQRAEDMLVRAAGEVNEGSIYTHANLGELYLHDVGHVPLALLHNTKSCIVGLKLWGASHPNVERKLREFAAILGAVGFSSHVSAVLQGDIQAFEEMLRVFTAQEPLLQCDLYEWQREEDPAALDYASRRWPQPAEATVVVEGMDPTALDAVLDDGMLANEESD